MAGDWIKLEHATPDKPEVFRMADILQIDPDTVVGKLARLWVWCDQQSINGKNLAVTDSFIDRVTHQPGFSAALREVSWLSARSGSLTIPNFDRHNGQTAKARALALDRKRKQRERGERDSCHDPSVTDSGPEKNSSLLFSDSSSPLNTEERSNPEPLIVPLLLNVPEFLGPWAEWERVRRRGKKPKTSWADYFAGQLAWLEKFGLAVAVEIVATSARNQWQGLFEPKRGGNGGVTRTERREAPVMR